LEDTTTIWFWREVQLVIFYLFVWIRRVLEFNSYFLLPDFCKVPLNFLGLAGYFFLMIDDLVWKSSLFHVFFYLRKSLYFFFVDFALAEPNIK